MTPERWRQVDGLFQSAAELDHAARAAFLDEVCGGDSELREEVESLLASDEEGLDIIDTPAYEAAAALLVVGPELKPGERLGQYEIVRLLGAGGMGEVYLARDTKLGRKVALKLLPADLAADPDRLRRFRREAETVSALNHPNVLTIHEVGEAGGRPFIVTEYVEGETLRERMRRGRLDLHEALEVAVQVAGALAAAHRAGVVHRDVKPENVMLRPDGYVKVLDFGLAKSMKPPAVAGDAGRQTATETVAGFVIGTVKYMSPEQARGEAVDERSDVFSLGAVLYEMVAGCVPFEGRTSSDLIATLLRDDPEPLTEFSPDAPEALQRIIDASLRKERGERYQTVQELVVDLKALREEIRPKSSLSYPAARPGWSGGAATAGRPAVMTDGVSAAASSQSKERRASKRRRYRVASISAATAVAVLSLAFGAYRYLGDRGAGTSSRPKWVTRLTSFGSAWSPAISPDGKYVTYWRSESGKSSLWLRQVGTPSEIQIVPLTEGAPSPSGTTFSPDGKLIYYSLYPHGGEPALYQVPVLGGAAKKIGTSIGPFGFSPDGLSFAYVHSHSELGETTVRVASADGTGEREVVKRRAPDYFIWGPAPAWSPDGRLIACAGQSAEDGFPRVVAINVENGTEEPITSKRWNLIGGMAWLPDRSGLVVAAREETSSAEQLWRVAYPGGEAQRITNDTSSYRSVSLTSDAGVLVTLVIENQSRIWVLPADGGKFSADAARQLSANKFEGIYGLSWTPDGRIVFTSDESGNTDIWLMDADGNGRRQLTDDPHTDSDPSVSPDGRYIFFMSNRTGADHIWRMNIDGSDARQMTYGRLERWPVCSPDGKWVAYNSWESGKGTIWKIPAEGGEPVRLTEVASFRPSFSPDGKLIAFRHGGGLQQHKVGITSSDGGHPVRTFDLPWHRHPILRWSPDGQALLYLSLKDGMTNVWSKPLDDRPAQQLTDFKTEGVWYFDLSRDGRQLALARGTQGRDVIMISDFR